jgi:hypothetical protein
MKKKMAGVLAILMVLCMGTTVYAADSPNGKTTYEQLAQDKKTAVSSVASDVSSVTVSSEAVSAENLEEAYTQADKAVNGAYTYDVLGAVELTTSDDISGGVTITFQIAGVKAGDNIVVFHKTKAGTWERIAPIVGDGYVTATFSSLSPVAIVSYPAGVTVRKDSVTSGSGDTVSSDGSDDNSITTNTSYVNNGTIYNGDVNYYSVTNSNNTTSSTETTNSNNTTSSTGSTNSNNTTSSNTTSNNTSGSYNNSYSGTYADLTPANGTVNKNVAEKKDTPSTSSTSSAATKNTSGTTKKSSDTAKKSTTTKSDSKKQEASTSTTNTADTTNTSSNKNTSSASNNTQTVTVNVTGGSASESSAKAGASTSQTSPKTGQSVPALPAIAGFALMGLAVCGKKARSL